MRRRARTGDDDEGLYGDLGLFDSPADEADGADLPGVEEQDDEDGDLVYGLDRDAIRAALEGRPVSPPRRRDRDNRRRPPDASCSAAGCPRPPMRGGRCNVHRAQHVRELARARQAARRVRLRREKRILSHMSRYGVDRATAERQLTPVLSPEQSTRYTQRRKAGSLPKWEPGRPRGWLPTRRPRGVRRRPGTTPKARRRRRWRALRDRREGRRRDLEEEPDE